MIDSRWRSYSRSRPEFLCITEAMERLDIVGRESDGFTSPLQAFVAGGNIADHRARHTSRNSQLSRLIGCRLKGGWPRGCAIRIQNAVAYSSTVAWAATGFLMALGLAGADQNLTVEVVASSEMILSGFLFELYVHPQNLSARPACRSGLPAQLVLSVEFELGNGTAIAQISGVIDRVRGIDYAEKLCQQSA